MARGEAGESSDIDVLVVLNGSVHPAAEIARMGKDVAEISLKRDVVLSCFYLSKAHYLSEKSPLALNMRREAVAVSTTLKNIPLTPLKGGISRVSRLS